MEINILFTAFQLRRYPPKLILAKHLLCVSFGLQAKYCLIAGFKESTDGFHPGQKYSLAKESTTAHPSFGLCRRRATVFINFRVGCKFQPKSISFGPPDARPTRLRPAAFGSTGGGISDCEATSGTASVQRRNLGPDVRGLLRSKQPAAQRPPPSAYDEQAARLRLALRPPVRPAAAFARNTQLWPRRTPRLASVRGSNAKRRPTTNSSPARWHFGTSCFRVKVHHARITGFCKQINLIMLWTKSENSWSSLPVKIGLRSRNQASLR